jgi:hypothetical protein
MTASVGQEVDAEPLSGAAPGSAQARANAHDPGGQDLGDLVEPLGRCHEVGAEGVQAGHCTSRHGSRQQPGSGGKLTSVRQ